MFFDMTIKPGIDRAQDRYIESISNGKKGGRPLKYDWNAVAAMLDSGISGPAVRKEFNIPSSTFSSWKKQYYDTKTSENFSDKMSENPKTVRKVSENSSENTKSSEKF